MQRENLLCIQTCGSDTSLVKAAPTLCKSLETCAFLRPLLNSAVPGGDCGKTWIGGRGRSVPTWLQSSPGRLSITPMHPGGSSHESGHKVTRSSPDMTPPALRSCAGQAVSSITVCIISTSHPVGKSPTCLKALLLPKQPHPKVLLAWALVPDCAFTVWQGQSCSKECLTVEQAGCCWVSAGHTPGPHFSSLCGCSHCDLSQGQRSQAL